MYMCILCLCVCMCVCVCVCVYGFQDDSSGNNSPANAGDVRDTAFIPLSVRSPGEGNGNPLQNS